MLLVLSILNSVYVIDDPCQWYEIEYLDGRTIKIMTANIIVDNLLLVYVDNDQDHQHLRIDKIEDRQTTPEAT